jgi:hypothetical protein
MELLLLIVLVIAAVAVFSRRGPLVGRRSRPAVYQEPGVVEEVVDERPVARRRRRFIDR